MDVFHRLRSRSSASRHGWKGSQRAGGLTAGILVTHTTVIPVKVLLSETELQQGVERLAAEITARYGRQPLTVVGVLTGSVVLLADLIRQLSMPLRVGLVQASSYRGTATQPGELSINAEFLPELKDRNVLLVDDIYDTGHTLTALVAKIQVLQPASISSAVLLRKVGQQEAALQPDFVAFDIPAEFVVGYGLDYNDLYRNLPYLAALEPDEIEPDDIRSDDIQHDGNKHDKAKHDIQPSVKHDDIKPGGIGVGDREAGDP